jgi:hypothetical protein
MTGPSRIDQTPVRLNTKVTEERQTPKTDFGNRLKDGLSGTASAVASGAAVAAPLVPGGAIISAALSGSSQLTGSLSSGQRAGGAGGGANPVGLKGAWGGTSTTPSTTTPSTSTPGSIPTDTYQQGLDLISAQQSANMQFLTLQSNMQNESQKFSTLSNVMKVRSDTAKNSIQNIH